MNIDFLCGRFAVAVSGGADSMALLYLIKSAISNQQSAITVLHVNHKLRDAADVEEQYIIDTCKKLNVPCVTFTIDSLPTANLENAARDARYKLMTDWCRENDVDTLLTAHQADDQIETFLMNLGRGSGVNGLASMRPETVRNGIKIVRPLLETSRADLEKYCVENNIKYFNDEMNDDERYTRVRIRKNRHLLRDKLGISDARILLAIKNLSRARDALECALHGDKFPSCGGVAALLSRAGVVPACAGMTNLQDHPDVARNSANVAPPREGNLAGRVVFNYEQLFSLPRELQLRFLGDTLRRIGSADYSPRLNAIERLLKKLENDTVTTLSHCTVRRLGDRILIVPEGESISFRNKKNETKTKNQKK